MSLVAALVFWALAARRYPPDLLGTGAASIVTFSALAEIALLGLGPELVRVLPRAGSDRRRLTAQPLALVAGASLVLAAGFLAGSALWAPALSSLRASALTMVWVVCATVLLAGRRLGESVWEGLGLGRWLAAERGALAALRLGMIVLLDPTSGLRPFLAWTVPLLVVNTGLVLPAWQHLMDRKRDRVDPELALPRLRSAQRTLRAMVDHGRPDWSAAMVTRGTVGLMALVVLAVVGPPSVAHLAVAGTIGLGAHRVASTLARALVQAPVSDEGRTEQAMVARALVGSGVAAIGAMAVAALVPRFLGTFSIPYAEGASTPTRLLVVAAAPWVAVQLHLTRVRRDRHAGPILALEVVMAAAALVLTWPLTSLAGTSGPPLTWLLVVLGGAAYALAVESVWWWGPRLEGRGAALVTTVVGLHRRWAELRLRRAMNQQVAANLEALYPSSPPWDRLSWDHDRQSIAVASHDGRPPLRLELARTPHGSELLNRRASALTELNLMTEIGALRGLIPYPIDHSRQPPVTYLVESTISGQPGGDLDHDASLPERLKAVVGAISDLHRATEAVVVMDQQALDRWVSRPLRALSEGCRVADEQLMALGRTLRAGLDGTRLTTGRLHGHLGLDQARFDSSGRLIGLVGWEWSDHGPVMVDWGSLTLSAMVAERGQDLGLVVRSLIEDPDVLIDHDAFAAEVPADLDRVAVVLFCWLHLLTPDLQAAAEHGIGGYWLARNVHPVLAALDREA